ncbi:MAG: putative sugar nucleotidyl transferase, partial [Planctomycetota bacterium]
MDVVCYEDALVDRLNPIVMARPAYAITCASFRLVDWLREIEGRVPNLSLSGWVRPHLRAIQTEDFDLPQWVLETLSPDRFESDSPLLLINARLIPSVHHFQSIMALLSSPKTQIVSATNDAACPAVACIAPADRATFLQSVHDNHAQILSDHQQENEWDDDSQPLPPQAAWVMALEQAMAALPTMDSADASAEPLHLLQWPHDVVRHHMALMNDHMQYRLAHGDYQQLQDGVFVAPGVEIGQYSSIDTSEGPILLEKNVNVGPFCYLSGPVWVGHGTRVIEHASLKDGVSAGHTVKIGGEVEASVIEPFSNKQHHGFLGHSYLGSWINLGAGTCNSDLKNTYGKINMQYPLGKVPTGMQFMG